MPTSLSAATAVKDAENANAMEGDAVDGNGSGDTNDDETAPFEMVLAPTVDLDLGLDDAIDPEDAAAMISCAVDVLMEALLPQIFVSTGNVMNAPDISFPRDCEPVPTPFDRHATKHAPKKTRQKKSTLKSTMYGGPTSRAPSRASSRATSRFGGSMKAPSVALRSAVMATKLAQLTRASADPFQIVPWYDELPKRLHTPGIGAQWRDDNHGTVSVAGSTSQRQVDVTEIQRRGEIERDISTREARRRLTQQIQRKGELPLKLRSLADPTVSFDKQEMLAASTAHGGAVSRLGSSRVGDTRLKTPAMGLPLSSLAKSVSTASGFSSISKPSPDEVDPSTTFRSEDYRDISSSVVLLGKGGEVLVGDNCYLVARKLRGEIAHDLSKKAMVEPRINLLAPQPDRETPTTVPESLSSPQEVALRSVGKAPLPALPAKKSSSQLKLSMIEGEQTPVNPAFEGRLGSFETYPRLEMDPSKTPLANGVTIIGDESSASSPTNSPQLRNTRGINKVSSPSRPHHLAPVEVHSASKEADLLASSNAPVPQQDAAPVVEKRTKVSNVEKSADVPKRTSNMKVTHLHSLRSRIPAQERRPPASKQSRNRFNLTQLEETAIAESMEHEGSAERIIGAPAIPRVKYIREFPSPPPGTIHIFGWSASLRDSEATDAFPFRTLPSIVKAKR